MSNFFSKPFRNILGSNTSQKITKVVDNVLDHAGLLKYKDLIEWVAVVYITGGGNIPLPGGGTWNIGKLGVNVKGNDVVKFFKTSKGAQIKAATVAQVTGGDPKTAGMLAGTISSLNMISKQGGWDAKTATTGAVRTASSGAGGWDAITGEMAKAGASGVEGASNLTKVAQFLTSDLGKVVTGTFIGNGGNAGFLSDVFGEKGGDIAGDLLTFMALAAAGEVYAKDAIKKAEELETTEYDTLKSMVEQSKQLSDPKYKEQIVQKGLEKVNMEYGAAKQQSIEYNFGHGTGFMNSGANAGLQAKQADARLTARRDLEMQNATMGLNALGAVMTPLSNAAARATAIAAEERAAPANFYMAIKQANRLSPADQYAQMQIKAMQDAEQRAKDAAFGNAALGGITNVLGNATGAGGVTGGNGVTGLPATNAQLAQSQLLGGYNSMLTNYGLQNSTPVAPAIQANYSVNPYTPQYYAVQPQQQSWWDLANRAYTK